MRLKIFILSTMLITLISGVLFYKNLTQIGPVRNVLKLDFEELRSIDYQVTSTALYLRKNLQNDASEIKSEIDKISELLSLINDINKDTPELKETVKKIQLHFNKRIDLLKKFEIAENDLRKNANALIPLYNQLEKKNIRFTVDKRDFYRECILDAFMFISFTHKENELRLLEDLKIVGQIINYQTEPVPEIQLFSETLDSIHKRVKEIDFIINELKNENISSEMKTVAKYYQESVDAKNEQNENLLTFMIAAIAIYLLFVIFVIRKN